MTQARTWTVTSPTGAMAREVEVEVEVNIF